MDIKDTKEGAELIWQLNKVGDYNTHKELWDAYYKLEEQVKNCSILLVSEILEQLMEMSNEANERSVRNTGELASFLQGKVEAYTMAIDIITNVSSR